MIQAYKGILRGNQIEWTTDGKPKSDQPLQVEVTVVEPKDDDDKLERGRRMAASLERLAAMGAFSEIADPMERQREIRKDRPLPGRE